MAAYSKARSDHKDTQHSTEFLEVLPQSIAATQLGVFRPLSENYLGAPEASEPGMSGTEPGGVSRRSWLTIIARTDGGIGVTPPTIIGVIDVVKLAFTLTIFCLPGYSTQH